MSISLITQPNDRTLYGQNIVSSEINGIKGNIIDPQVNTVDQVLTITSLDPKEVAFKDPQGGTPPTLGEPDGYVLAIQDNTTGQLFWKQDAQGSIPDPLVLSGADNANKFQVKNNAGDNKFTVNTLADRVDIAADTIEISANGIAVVSGNSATVIQSVSGDVIIDSTTGNANTNIDANNISLTTAGSVEVDGANNANKFQVKNNAGDNKFTVDTVNSEVEVDDATLVLRESGSGTQTTISKTNLETIIGTNENISIVGTGSSVLNIETGKAIFKEYNDTERLKVQNQSGISQFKIDTVANKTIVEGDGVKGKVEVKNSVGDVVFQVDTNADVGNVLIAGAGLNQKLAVFDSAIQKAFTVNTDPTQQPVVIGGNPVPLVCPLYSSVEASLPTNDWVGYICKNGNANFYLLNSNLGQNGMYFDATETFITNAVGTMNINGEIETNITRAGAGGNPVAQINQKPITGTDIEDDIKVSITVGSNQLVVGPLITITGPCSFDTVAPITTIAPTQNTDLTNKAYVDNKVGNLASGLSASLTAQGAVVGSQVLDPQLFEGQPSVFPNTFQIGDSFNLTASGNCSYNNGDVVIVSVNAVSGSTTSLATISFTAPNTGASFFEIEADFTIRNIVAGVAEIVSSVDFTYQDGGSFVGSRSLTITNTIDTTQFQVLQLVSDLSGANAATTMTTQLYVLKRTH
jgi:hypothetical protein